MTDIRYELSIYGDFLQDIPKRLGRNAALDSSVAALTFSFQAVHTRVKPAEVYLKYATALSSLRLCLDDPVEAQSPETLCAIWMIVICQVRVIVLVVHMDDLLILSSTIGLEWWRRRRLCLPWGSHVTSVESYNVAILSGHVRETIGTNIEHGCCKPPSQ